MPGRYGLCFGVTGLEYLIMMIGQIWYIEVKWVCICFSSLICYIKSLEVDFNFLACISAKSANLAFISKPVSVIMKNYHMICENTVNMRRVVIWCGNI